MSKKYLYCLLFAITGLLLIVFAFIVKSNFPNDNLGARFRSGDFYESDFYLLLGAVGVCFGVLYAAIYRINKIQLDDKLTIRHYLCSLPMLFVIVLVPILDRYFPTDQYRDSIFAKVFDLLIPISLFTFVASIFFVCKNFIQSTRVYFMLKKRWD